VLFSEHNTGGELIAVTVGIGLTNKVNVRVLVQTPLALVTVYVVVTIGLTATLAPINAPGLHE